MSLTKIGWRLVLMMVLGLVITTSQVTLAQTSCDQEVVVQADDWLSKIAEKAYGDPLAYPAIVEATNDKAASDESFATIDNADVIEVGWKLCLPSTSDAEAMINQPLTAPATAETESSEASSPAASGSESSANESPTEVGRLVLATTTSTYDSGLLDAILPNFETDYAADVEVIAVGTGQAISLGENGDADLILVHARSREDAFVEAGYGVNRREVMYNDFVIVGPAADQAGVQGMSDAVAALTQIAETNSPFISRGDDSGTHTKEQTLWAATNIPMAESPSIRDETKTFSRPEGEWYNSVGQGMGATLTVANEQQAYTISDRATFLARQNEGIDLEILVEGDSRLFNPYGVIAVNPERHPNVNYDGAMAFIEWLTSVEIQQMISEYGVEKFGQPLFIPDSDAWNAAQP